jgi:hypothetical protein
MGSMASSDKVIGWNDLGRMWQMPRLILRNRSSIWERNVKCPGITALLPEILRGESTIYKIRRDRELITSFGALEFVSW